MQRRTFLQTSAAACLASCSRTPEIAGRIVGANHAAGHWLRDLKSPPQPSRTEKADVVIAGGGMAGLVAAWRLQAAGVQNIVLLDLETAPGGNARSGQNAVTAYPWGAHYVPVPGEDSVEVRRLFEELGIITGHDAAGRPVYEERYLCSDPQERLWVDGDWQEGLLPMRGASPADRAEMDRFMARMHELKSVRGRDGRRVFTLPVDAGSRDEEWRQLDTLTMEAWMEREGFKSGPLRWYVNYCCRDDYGGGVAAVSAWAGLHYFASRDESDVLTWPDGNGWLVKQLLDRLTNVTFRQGVVYKMTEKRGVVSVDCHVLPSGEVIRWQAGAAVCAMPRFVAQRVVSGLPVIDTLQYSPWVVANLAWNGEAPPTWDNVFMDSTSLGYVVATHQSFNPYLKDTVLTWYKPLDHLPPPQARQEALDKPWQVWRDEILADLQAAHPDAAERVSNLDVMVWGHGMIRPVPGFISGEDRRRMAAPLGRIAFAHTDMSGISLFEEACSHGASAAESVLRSLGKA